jgi:hypothetical protein
MASFFGMKVWGSELAHRWRVIKICWLFFRGWFFEILKKFASAFKFSDSHKTNIPIKAI